MHLSEYLFFKVIQRRGQFSGSQLNFTRSWADYKAGFGDLNAEFWLEICLLCRVGRTGFFKASLCKSIVVNNCVSYLDWLKLSDDF